MKFKDIDNMLNKKFKILLVSLVIICLFATQGVFAADSDSVQNLTANDNDVSIASEDNADILSDPGNNFYSLSQEIDAAEGTLYLEKDYKFDNSDEDKALESGIVISKPLKIIGNGHSIDGDGYNPLLFIRGSDVILKDITFRNGVNNDGASSIVVLGNNVEFDFCNFENNQGNNGGAIFWSGDNGIISNALFNNNNATYEGGAVCWNGADGRISNAMFIENNASDGGAVCWNGDNGKIFSSSFNFNAADINGGAVCWNGQEGTIYYSDLDGNEASNGGAVYWNGADGAIVESSPLKYNKANYGGAVYWNGQNGTIEDSTLYKNSASGEGGAVCWNGADGVINGSTLSENSANYGGAVGWSGSNGIIENSTLNNNKASYVGGAVNWNGQSGTIKDSTLNDNTASQAGAIQWNGANCLINNTEFDNNHAPNEGGAIYLNSPDAVLSNVTMYNNYEAKNGGAVYVTVRSKNAAISGNFSKNTALQNGGAIYWEAANGKLDNSYFKDNYVYCSSYYDGWDVSGGAVCWNGDNALVNNSQFISNKAYYSGGYANQGGAISFHDHNATVENCYFYDNFADSDGGAIYWKGEDGIVFNSTFDANYAYTSGGAIDSSGKNILINQSVFTNNNAFIYIGGAIALDAYGTIDNSTFIGNFAYKGGAIHWIDEGRSIVNNSKFYNNSAVYSGGAIACDYHYDAADKFIQNSLFVNNSCVNYGGAIGSLNTEMDNCTFINNTAHLGGAIHSYTSKINGSHFYGNTADYGNDLYHSSTVDLINTDIPKENIEYVPSDLVEIIDYTVGNSTRLMNNSYIGMCFERNSLMPQFGTFDESLHALINVLTGESIVEYLKLLIYDSFNSMDDVFGHEGDNYTLYPEGYEGNISAMQDKSNWVPISRTDYYSRVVHIFSDCDFRISEHPEVKRILALYNNGTRVSQDQIKVVDGKPIKYHFSTLISPASQSLFLFLINPIPKIEKDYLNTTEFIIVNDTVAFNITINNTSDKPLINVTLHELFNSSEFEFISYSNDTWNKTGDYTFVYCHADDVGDVVVYYIKLVNTGGCTLENIVFNNIYNSTQLKFVTGLDDGLTFDGENFIYKYEVKPNEIKTLTLWFETLSKEVNLTNMTPNIVSYTPSGNNPKISGEREYGGRYPAINVGESSTMTIWFKTLSNGTLINNVTYNDVNINGNMSATNKTRVYNPDMSVEKISLNKTVELGDLVSFVIIVKNTGDCNLTGVYVIDEYYSQGLVLDHMVPNKDWTFDGKNKFVYGKTLCVGESASFTIVFKTTTLGFKTNTVIAGNNLTNITVNSTNTTNVEKTEIPPVEPPEPVQPENETNPVETHEVSDKVVSENATGNPIGLLLVLFAILIGTYRKQK